MKSVPTIFLSYSWSNKKQADIIDDFFSSLGITFRRDIRDIKYKSSIKDFMGKIGDSDYSVILVSDNYLNSINCMFEAVELMRDKDFKKRMLQLLIPDAKIFSSRYRATVISNWDEKFNDLKKQSKNIPLETAQTLAEELKKIKNIAMNIGEFMEVLVEENSPTFEQIENNNFKDLIQFINIEDKELASELIEINDERDKETRLLKLHEFARLNKDYSRVYFSLAKEQKNPHNQIYYYDYAIKIDSKYVEAYCNRGNSKADLEDLNDAIIDYGKALEIDEGHVISLVNRGIAKGDLGDITGALADFSEAISIDRTYANAFVSRAILREVSLGDFQGAIEDFSMSMDLELGNTIFLYRTAMLKIKVGDKKGAIDDMTRIFPLSFKLCFEIADLKKEIGDKEGAKYYRKKGKELKRTYG